MQPTADSQERHSAPGGEPAQCEPAGKQVRPLFQKPTIEALEKRFLGFYASHDFTPAVASAFARIRHDALKLALAIVQETPCSSEQTRALNAIDEAMLLAYAAIVRH